MHSKKAFGQHHEKCFGSMNTSLLKSLNADMQITNTKRQYRPKVSRAPIPSGNIIFVVLYWGGKPSLECTGIIQLLQTRIS